MIISKNTPKPLFILILLGLLCLLTYSASLQNNFLIDDHDHILNNIRLKHPKFILYEIVPWMDPYQSPDATARNDYYRPLTRFGPMLGYYVFGENPLGYYIANLILFIFCCFSIYLLLLQLLKDWRVSLLASALFAVHPINMMCVNYITAVVYSIQMIAMCWAFIFYEKKKIPLSLGCFAVALMCHDTVIALPLYLLTTALFFHQKKPSWKLLAPYFLFVFLILILQVFSHYSKVDYASSNFTWLAYIAGLGKIFTYYFEKFFLLFGVVLIWTTPFDEKNAYLWIALLALFIGIFLWCFRYRKSNPLIPWAASWIAIGFAMSAYGTMYVPSQGMAMEPHWLYFSSIAFFALISSTLLKFTPIISRKFNIILISIIFALCILNTNYVNRQFNDEEKYCHYWLAQVPHLETPLSFLASLHLNKGNYQQAKYYLQKMDETSDITQLKWGYWEYAQGNHLKARPYFEQVIASQPKAASVYVQLANIAAMENDAESAITNLQKAIHLDPLLLDARIMLAHIYLLLNKGVPATALLEENLKILPNHPPTIDFIKTLEVQIVE